MVHDVKGRHKRTEKAGDCPSRYLLHPDPPGHNRDVLHSFHLWSSFADPVSNEYHSYSIVAREIRAGERT